MGSVIKCSESRAIEILNSPGVIERLSIPVTKIEVGSLYLINGRMLLVLLPINNQCVEAHISQSRENWKFIHDDIEHAKTFITNIGYSQIATNVNKKLTQTKNLLAKHGFDMICEIYDEEVLLWDSN